MIDKTFSPADQAAFARLSGDYNPIHLDDVAARRLLFGSSVVHGVHALLWCMDAICPVNGDGSLELLSVKAVFTKPIGVGETVTLAPTTPRAGKTSGLDIKAKLIVNGAAVAAISVQYRPAIRSAERVQPESSFPERLSSRDLTDTQLDSMSGSLSLHLHASAAAELFPHIVRTVPAIQLASLLATTRVVGVHCPGLNSVFTELSLSAVDNAVTEFAYRVSEFDKRFGLVTIDFDAPKMTGRLGAFRRPAPRQQMAYGNFLQMVGHREFAGCRALVIGGSRGLGEVVVKILCAGGADVRLTYHRGTQDAKNIANDIAAHGGVVSIWQYDIADAALPDDLVVEQDWVPTHVLYFATPHIFSGAKGVFSPRLFNRFCDYFVLAFTRIFTQLNAIGTKNFFLPSSSAIDEMPLDMGEYVAAKSAAEHAARMLESATKGVVIAQPRLPRLATDQTVTLAGSDDADPAPVLLQALRDFIGAGR